MSTDNRGIDMEPGRINRELQDLKRMIEDLRSERRGANTTIGTGALVVTDSDGTEIFRIGDQPFGDRGLAILRENGVRALTMRKTFSNSVNQHLTLTDASNNPLLAEEALGVGLAVPYLPIPLQPVTASSTALSTGPWGYEVTSSAATGTWVSVHQAWYARHNAYGLFRMRIAASDTTTSAEVRVIDVSTGLPLNIFLAGAWLGTRAAGSTGYTEVTNSAGGLGLPGSPHTSISVAVQVRRTAGAGTLTTAVPEARGWAA